MPKNTVSDPITDQEMAFAHLILSGTMNDRRAAEAVGLNPDTAAYTKSKPRVRNYMIQHRAAVMEKLVEQEADGLRKLNIGRDQVLTRLWELASLSSEATRGSIAGQVKALWMIVAIEGLIPKPDPARHLAQPKNQSAPPPFEQQISVSERRPQQQQQTEREDSAVAASQAPPAVPQAPESETPSQPRNLPRDTPFPIIHENQPSPLNPFINPEGPNRIPVATAGIFDAVLDATTSLRLPFSPKMGLSAWRR
jgi:hypothetical protein